MVKRLVSRQKEDRREELESNGKIGGITMMFTTHVALAVLIFYLIAYTGLLQPYTMLLIVVIIGSLLPDIDHPQSYISSRNDFTRFLSGTLTKELTTHRSHFHTIYAAVGFAVLTIIVWLVFDISNIIHPLLAAFGMFLGYTAHLLGDAMTSSGIYWLGKGKEKYHFMKRGFIRTGSRSETVLQYLFFIAVALLFLKVGLV